ncbi:MAG: PD-(D/E)XK nuclease family protein [Alphaproteobacteria bacterium]|nr:PD-(D/E)XK nuclease family protein [Alphaproteobacteria bacterium]
MIAMCSNVFNIPGSCPFWETIANIYLKKFSNKELELASVLFMVPNRRACLSLTNAFVRIQGLKPTILPQIVPISEIDEDEMLFGSFNLEEIWPEIPPPISREERLFLFARLILSKPNDFGLKSMSPAQAISLAQDLATLIDTAYNQGLSFDKLHDLVPEKYATHWQETLKLLKIITEFWPQILEERGAIDTSLMKNIVLSKQALLWRKENTSKNIIIAGVSASFPSIVEMFETVKNLPNGEIYFAGIDNFADDDYWEAIDEVHPQFEIKDLLNKINIDRKNIANVLEPRDANREQFISEIMRPAIVSNKWRSIADDFNLQKSLENITLLTLKNQRDEALAIALKMREVLNYPEKTAALVSYDRNLARRVSSELKRFGVEVDDSAGIPLNLSPIGIYLRVIVEAAENLTSSLKIVDLLKNPFTLLGFNKNEFRSKVYDFETSLRMEKKKNINSEKFWLRDVIIEKLSPLSELLSQDLIDFGEVLRKNIEIAEEIANSDTTKGKNFLWRGDCGKIAVRFITKILETSSLIGKISGKDYLPMLCQLMSNETVRTTYGTHPRLSILGPIEAQLQNFDYIIIGEVNEGIWPKLPQADMWMSRPMMKDFGFALPEKNIGILANSFANFMKSPNVILTRAERIGESPTQKSRWLLRIETVLNAFGVDISTIMDKDFSSFVMNLDKPKVYKSIKAPAPCPPVASRPRKLSASGVDLLIADPYSVFAKYILKLYPLDNLDEKPDQRDYGSLIHEIIEEFNTKYDGPLPLNALDVLVEIGKRKFDEKNLDNDIRAFWFPKFLSTAKWIIQKELDYRDGVKKIHNEVSGEISYNIQNGDFVFTAKADRIDELKNNDINIFDYKTGSIPTKSQVKSGHAMQLLLEGIIARKKAYPLGLNSQLSNLIYWKLGKEELIIDKKNDELDKLLDEAEEYLVKLMNTFDFETTPYHSRPTPKFIPKNKDYEHLARIREWSVQEDGEDSDE